MMPNYDVVIFLLLVPGLSRCGIYLTRQRPRPRAMVLQSPLCMAPPAASFVSTSGVRTESTDGTQHAISRRISVWRSGVSAS
ncbi:hypothetical protein OF83DRAFT_1119061 [Amylostereum chailletii]|nr:hypothetical protein OF83DRAFT_1119061 [Amylostereum chailletii]